MIPPRTTRRGRSGPDRLALVVGLGTPDRGDDAVGLEVARHVIALALPGAEVVAVDDTTELIGLWEGHDLVVVVDAVRTGAPPGTVIRLETGVGQPSLPESTWGRPGRAGTHAFGLAAVVELARAVHHLPRRVVLVGVEVSGVEVGTGLSPPVTAAVPGAVVEVVEALGIPRHGLSLVEPPRDVRPQNGHPGARHVPR